MEKRKIYGTILGVTAFLILLVGLSYAYFYWSSSNDDRTNVNLTVSRELAGAIKYNQGTSILGTDNRTLEMVESYTQSGISTVIEFWKKPTSSAAIYGQLYIEVLSMLSSTGTTNANIGKSDTVKWVVTTYTVDNPTEVLVNTGTFNGKEQGDKFALFPNDIELSTIQTFYKVYLWFDSNALDPGALINGESLSVEVSAFATDVRTDPALNTLNSLNITPSDTVLTTFATTSKLDGTTGVYASEDDLGTSYYFRGNVTNNYVKFGQYTEDAYLIINTNTNPATYSYASSCTASTGITCQQIASSGDYMYWRIVRINGDGTIRLIYDGTSVHANNEETTDRFIGNAPYNTNYNDNAYVGYMYGAIGQNSYEATHANTNNSDMKKVIDAWYAKYLNTNYGTHIADAIYCNDRTIVTDANIYSLLGTSAVGGGFGTEVTIYSIYGRVALDAQGMIASMTPTLKCNQVNDRFTKNATVGGVAGNAKLTHPIGAITADEMTFAGSYLYNDDKYISDETYLYNGIDDYWLLSPDMFYGYAHMFFGYEGTLNFSNVVGNSDGVRPSISLNSNAITGGLGTPGSPFTVSS